MNNSLIIRDADESDIVLIQELAYKIWPDAYNRILPEGQVAYMLDLFYSTASLKKQIFHLKHNFLILEKDNHAAGFASYANEGNGYFKLNKLYVLPEMQRTGAGRKLLDHVIENIRRENANSLILTVNRNNLNAKKFYEKYGFIVNREENVAIGNGYFMDDYIMELDLRD